MRLEVRNATFAYRGGDEILRGISFSVSEGDLLSILGPNGCGKTTLIKCLCGMLKLGGGEILLNDKAIHSLTRAEIARNIGYIAQEHGQVFPYSVLEVALMGRAPHLGWFSLPSDKDIGIAEKTLEMMGISHLRDRPYTEISGGERQLTLIAAVLAQQPKMLVLDEPTSHLDLKNQIFILGIMRKFAKEGLSVVMSTHLPNHALHYSSRVVLMGKGGDITVGSAEEVITEENLSKTYGVDIKVLSVSVPMGTNLRFCMPVECAACID